MWKTEWEGYRGEHEEEEGWGGDTEQPKLGSVNALKQEEGSSHASAKLERKNRGKESLTGIHGMRCM